jgi:hypothetical protein
VSEKLKNLLIISLITYAVFQHRHIQSLEKETPITPPQERVEILSEVEAAEDKRIEILENYFVDYESPLVESAETFIEVADQYSMDWTLLPAIASQESGFGKHTPSCAPYNPFGWTSTTSPCGFWRFESFDDAVRHTAERISNLPCYAEFRATGNIRKLAEKYNSSQPDEWIAKVGYFQASIKIRY